MRLAKVYARTFGYSVPANLPAGKMEFTVEYKLLVGDKQGGKVTFIVDDVSSDDKLKADIREKLADHLTQALGTDIKPRDIVGYSA